MRKGIKAYQQGNLDGLCGIYALINAYKLVNKQNGITFRTGGKLFHASLGEIGKDKVLDVLQNGMYINLLLSINKRVFHKQYPHIRLKRPFLKRKPTTQQIMREITSIILNEHGVVLLSYSCESYGHWTVIYDETPHSYLLADSDNVKYLRKQSFQGKSPRYDFGDILPIVFYSSS